MPVTKPKKPHPLLTAIIVNTCEISDYARSFKGFCKPIPLSVYTPTTAVFRTATDLVIYDFGELSAGRQGMMLGNVRRLLHWAQDNPNALIVVVSQMTFTGYVEPELNKLLSDEEGLMPHNITFWNHGKDPIPLWFKQAHQIKGLSQPFGNL